MGSGEVDLTSEGCGGSLPVTQPTTGEGTDPVPWVSEGAGVIGSTPLLQDNRLAGTLTNISDLLVDAKSNLPQPQHHATTSTTDRPTTVRFTDGRTLQLRGAGRHLGQVS